MGFESEQVEDGQAEFVNENIDLSTRSEFKEYYDLVNELKDWADDCIQAQVVLYAEAQNAPRDEAKLKPIVKEMLSHLIEDQGLNLSDNAFDKAMDKINTDSKAPWLDTKTYTQDLRIFPLFLQDKNLRAGREVVATRCSYLCCLSDEVIKLWRGKADSKLSRLFALAKVVRSKVTESIELCKAQGELHADIFDGCTKKLDELDKIIDDVKTYQQLDDPRIALVYLGFYAAILSDFCGELALAPVHLKLALSESKKSTSF